MKLFLYLYGPARLFQITLLTFKVNQSLQLRYEFEVILSTPLFEVIDTAEELGHTIYVIIRFILT